MVEDVPRSKPTKVAIVEDDEEGSEDEEDEGKPVINGTRIMITDDDEDEDTDDEEEAAKQPPAKVVVDRKASDAAKATGSQLLGKGDLEGAEAEYSKALELDATNHAARNNRALCRLKAGKFAGAVADASHLIELADSEGEKSAAHAMVGKALFRRASALEKSGDKAKAIKDLKRLLTAEPTNKDAKKMLVKAVIALGHFATTRRAEYHEGGTTTTRWTSRPSSRAAARSRWTSGGATRSSPT